MKHTSATALVTVILTGCDAPEPYTVYPGLYESRSCALLQKDLSRLGGEISNLRSVERRNAPLNTLIGIGTSFDHRASHFYGLTEDVSGNLEVAARHYEAAQNAALGKGCAIPT
ncbi:MAG: hypothetical protein GDA53_08470 [Rhodobacteraceae bacterium]|nr:hypothetical protein [Paracoccaceae bacterium]